MLAGVRLIPCVIPHRFATCSYGSRTAHLTFFKTPADIELRWMTDGLSSSVYTARANRSEPVPKSRSDGTLRITVTRSGVQVPLNSTLRLTPPSGLRSQLAAAPVAFDVLIEPLLLGMLQLTCLPTVVMVLVVGGAAWMVAGGLIGLLERGIDADELTQEIKKKR